MANLTLKDVFSYFRIGLVTGLVDKDEMVRWADQEIMRSPDPAHEVIELSLCGPRPYSEIIYLLNSFQSRTDYGVVLKLVLARAGMLLEQDPSRAGRIIMGLRLLNEEEYLAKEVKSQLAALRSDLDLHLGGGFSTEELLGRLSSFLEPYAQYRPLLEQFAADLSSGVDLSS